MTRRSDDPRDPDAPDDPVTVRFTYRGGTYRLDLNRSTAERFPELERTLVRSRRRHRARVSLWHRLRSER